MAEPILDFTQTPCTTCGQISTVNEEMIACETCNSWHHFRCVGVTAAIRKERKWFCLEAACQEASYEYQKAKEGKKTTRAKKNAEESDKSSVKSDRQNVQTLEQKLKAMEEKQKRIEQELETEWRLKEKELAFKRAMEQKKIMMEKKLRAQEEEDQRFFQETRLKEKKEHIDRMKTMQQSYHDAMKSLDDELNALKVTRNPMEGGSGLSATTGIVKLSEKNISKLSNKTVVEDDEDDNEDEHLLEDISNSDGSSEFYETVGNNKVSTIFNKSEQRKGGPTKMQMSARNGITKKLPVFSGKPEEWPLFYGTYQASNEACGYSNIENLVRLQESLKGPALDLVRGQLLLPQSVPKVIAKLRQLYGRPEQLLQSHLEKVRKLEPPKSNKLASFIPFGTAVEQLCEHLEAAELTQHLVNPLLIQDLVDKLPDGDKREWVRYKRNKGEVTLRTLTDFLAEIVADACEANVNMEFLLGFKSSSGVPSARGWSKEKGVLFNHCEAESSNVKDRKTQKPCKACQRTDHRLRFCQDFKTLEHADRMEIVNRWKLCHVCLNEHGGTPCKFKIRCNVGECTGQHNPLLHPNGEVFGTSAHINTNNPVLFRMIPVKLHYGDRSITLLAFLDEGASVTLMEKQLADRLGVVGVQEKLTIKWTADITRVEKGSRRLNVWISAADSDEKLLLKTVRTVEKLMLPPQSLDAQKLSNRYEHMRNLPISSYDGRPEMLIGLNNIHSFAPVDVKVGTNVEPIAVQCKLGWTVYGPTKPDASSSGHYLGCHQEVTNEDIHELLKCQYALEESVVKVSEDSAEERRAREILERSTKRVNGHFETGLLWKSDDPRFPDSFPMAFRRLKQLEKQLAKNPELDMNVRQQIKEYQQKGYAHLATADELSGTEPSKTWYLPLNVVLNPKKPGKVRLVWDAAATVQGVSLNSQLLKGPDMLVPLVTVITGFRERRIAFGGDLREMYHQLKIIAKDKQAQRFLFRENSTASPSIYVMDVATFGSTSSPCSAQFVKNKNAAEYAAQFPEAAEAIIHRHYVDDYFDSVDTVEEAIHRAKEVSFVHSKAGFEIRNWVSNSPEFLQSLGVQRPTQEVHFNRDKQTDNERVLGIIWDPEQDEFSFSTQQREELKAYFQGDKRPTKRIVLSSVMGFFDPLGLLSQFTIHGKIIIQHLWRSGCDWDDQISDDCWGMWKRWIGLLPKVDMIRIPRCYLGDAMLSSVDSLEVHIFSDASEHAYGCVAYLRAVINGKVRCTLAMSRSKVAPLKRQSIPRLELMAALLAARMKQTILATHSLKISRCILWTDSRTVCSWIRADQHKYKQFIAFRVGEILESTKVTDWRWIPSKLNLADVLTKWGLGPPLESDGEWFNAQAFLYQHEDQWPSQDMFVEDTDEEARGVVLFHGLIDAQASSRWMTIVRVTANVLRFITNCKRKRDGLAILTSKATENQRRLIKSEIRTTQRPFQKEEFIKAENILWKQIQFENYGDEMSALMKNMEAKPGQPLEKIKKSSCIYKLTPVIDEEGVLRMGGRMGKSKTIPFDKKYPIILSRKHEVTKKLIQFYHEKYGHANRETVFNELRQKFWIPNLRAAILQVMHECMWCKVKRCRPHAPIMAPLPVQRITSCLRPFSSVGVDYLGPVEVTIGRRKEKRWVAVFTCLAVRAVHLEVIHSLTTQSCLMAIRRFACKRGMPDEIFSDNATCFKGADSEMQRIKKLIGSRCAEKISSSTTTWHFNPPGAPHMGGIWERMVRSVKEAMTGLNYGRSLTDEILTTALAEAEDMINTRPLTYVPQ
ncbi:uncharacterized protein LOC131678398 [Topomyia yanbarensis]|uniref:uncharacterized protein LOC131678398 n=1 Tax=Topomyia yanbarensis TaxID=2498891 RepID=UPI00273A9606|nr:uncharacterized protein LOC131678398 [Topomyia yanbarensis]